MLKATDEEIEEVREYFEWQVLIGVSIGRR